MKYTSTLLIAVSSIFLIGADGGCDLQPTSDQIQQHQQEQILQEGTAQIGMPAIKNFRERKILKTIFELRDQDGLVTYTYLENLTPTIVRGHTALGGKLTFIGQTIGYGIPYATEFTSPIRPALSSETYQQGNITVPQADPNGLFPPSNADGTWILMKDPNGPDIKTVYIEPRIITYPWALPLD